MRNITRRLIEEAARSEERIGLDGSPTTSTRIGAEIIRLARMATAIHLASSVGDPHDPSRRATVVTTRETTG